MDLHLQGKAALVTASSSGIGKAAADTGKGLGFFQLVPNRRRGIGTIFNGIPDQHDGQRQALPSGC